MRVLVMGGSGFLGAHVWERLRRTQGVEAVGTYGRRVSSLLRPVDLTSSASVRRLVDGIRPDVLVWCARHTRAGLDERALHEVGLRAALSAAGPDVRLVFVSSDGVLPGARGPCTESAEPAPMINMTPLAQYTNAKIAAEKRIARECGNHCIARVGPIFGRTVQGDLDDRCRTLLENLKRGEICRCPANLWRTRAHVEDLAEALCELAAGNLRGVIHLGPERSESHFTFALAAARAFGYSERLIEPFDIDPDDARRREVRLDTTMDTSLARSTLRVRFRTVSEALV